MDKNPDCKNVVDIVEKEMKLNIHILSGNNNEKHGHKKGDPYGSYESASRSILRLIWFLTLLTHLFKNLRAYPEETMEKIASKSYNDSIAHFHPPVLRLSLIHI
eukprot:TRINITY_DN16937_c0_g1_i1.p1 TRINITY_DN16937_c0_g1~~TRINITY_DN16937_c0_g1_i1.p1  ORF type:complete len:104 (+),score=16.20 TRINITY_DN16937_c0_g1_i1:76-387(+)